MLGEALALPAYSPHAVHAAERHWPQSNCSLDLWITYLNHLGLAPEALMGALVQLDYEGDQFTFCKFEPADLASMHGLVLRELAMFDRLQDHVAAQVARGHLVLVELDGFHMPDTRSTSYQREHSKTTIGIEFIDPDKQLLGYFHNAGRYVLQGDDYRALFAIDSVDRQATGALLPYTEVLQRKRSPLQGEALRTAARVALQQHLLLAPAVNPFLAYQQQYEADLARVIERGNEYFHLYAFNHFRQFGAVFGLLDHYLRWLGDGALLPLAAHCDHIAAQAKLMQFRVVRAVARRKPDDSGRILSDVAERWDAVIGGLRQHLG
ncbi:DUF1839 family protein [Curvibacter gracilis]|uniref:DUF1839 family protein n=1 Tax=Curvibacter gracilis TaxID=230310 RepID=UPI0004AD54DA|nr:DUF1839 family protein [Curvibacter gracilis]